MVDPLVIRLRENETSHVAELSVEQAKALHCLNREGQLTERQLRVTPSWDGGYDLSAGAYIGTIALDGLRIVIEPKIPIANLFYMLTYAHELPSFGSELSPLVSGEALFDFIVRIFVSQVDDVVRRGIHRGYVDQKDEAAYLRGQLLLADQLRRGPLAIRFHQRTNEFTADLLENRILRTALAMLSRVRYEDAKLGPRVRRTLGALSEASPVGVVPADCDRVVYTRLNERYRSPINLARLFLNYLSLEGSSGETPFATFLVPMYRLFELFIARLLIQELAPTPRYHVADQGRIWLDESHRLEGRPDLVLRRDGRDWLVLDTKYKVYGDKPTNDDINQMVTYCHTLRVGRGVLIYPGDRVADQFMMHAGVRLETQSLSLTGSLKAFQMRCAAFAAALTQELMAEMPLDA